MINRALYWKYRNTALFVVSLIALFFLADTDVANTVIGEIGGLGYLGAFIVGIFFVSTFTVAPALVVLLHLAHSLDPVLISLCVGAGGVVGDIVIFRFLRDGVFNEIRPLFAHLKGSPLDKLLQTPYFAWLPPVAGAFIIASPFPDEVGIALMGLSKIKLWQFALLAFALNSTGIFIIVTLSLLL